MRDTLSNALFFSGYIAALIAAIAWGYFIWGFDWGHFGSRGWGLMLMVFMFGAIIAAIVAMIVVIILHGLLFPEDKI